MKKQDLSRLVQELEKRGVEPFSLEAFLFDKQLEFVKDPHPFKAAVTSRRAGKSVSCAADLCYVCTTEPDVVGLYVTLSRSNAKRIIWPELKRISKRFTLKADFNESELKCTFPNGSVIYCSGASDKSEIEKFRGLSLKIAYIDECQSFPAYLQDLIDDVIAPALMDHAGTLCLIGTPGPIPAGFFYETSRSTNWKQFHWTFFNNPHIAAKSGMPHMDILQRELKRRGVTKDNPSVKREWYGEWILDSDSLVYQFNNELNIYNVLPKLESAKAKYTYILGIDVGFTDADALAVLAYSDADKTTYLVEEVLNRKQGLTELVEQVEYLRKKYDFSKIVMDMGGLGKKLAEEMIRRYKLPVEAADKNRKNEHIELLNDAMRTGLFKAKQDSLFAQDAMRVEWDLDKSTPDRKVISSRFHSDITDAVLYAYRVSYAFTYEAPKPKAKEGSKEWADELEDKAEEYFKRLEEGTKDPFGGLY